MTALRWLWQRRHERPRFVALAALTGGFLLASPAIDVLLRDAGVAPAFVFWDFGAYGGAVRRWRAGEAIYVATDDGGFHGMYLYPPVVLLLFWPFAQLSYPLPATLWGVLSVGLLWVGMQALLRANDVALDPLDRLLLLWLVVGFQPLLLAVKLGQTAGFLTGVLCLAYAALVTGDRANATEPPAPTDQNARVWSLLSGGLTATTCFVKLTYATAAAHLLADRDRLVGGVAAIAGLSALSLAVFGVDAHLAYLDVLRWGVAGGVESRPPVLWLPPYYQPLYVLGEAALAVRVLLSLAIALLVRSAVDADREAFALGVAAVPLVAPQTYTYYLVALLPAAAVLLVGELRRDGVPEMPVLSVLLAATHSYGLKLLVDARFLFAVDGLRDAWLAVVPLLQPGLWGNLLLVGLAAWRVWERSRVRSEV